jgi:acetyltransferase
MKSGVSDLDTSGIEFFYDPRSIAIVGASPDRQKPSGRPLAALQERGFAGKLFAVNPRYQEIGGTPCYPTILDVPDDVEMAIISIPAQFVLEALEQCVAKGVKAAVIFSAGFSEIGAEGEALQRRMTELAKESGLRILGPNSFGLIRVKNAVMASFAHIVDLEPVRPATLGFVTQSGAFGAMTYGEATEAGVGFSSFTSVGNEADAEFSDFVGYLLDDPETQVIGGYLEGANDGAKLRRVAEGALERRKPIVMMKVGRTGAGARAASSHTGSLAGDDQVYDAFFRQMGIVRIQSLGELTAFCILHRGGRSFRGKRVAILSGSGGHGVVLADRCESLGLSVPEITGATREKLERYLPHFGSARNPIDLTAQGGVDTSMLGNCLRALVSDDGIDVILAHVFFLDRDGTKRAEELVEIYRSTEKAIVLTSHRRVRSDVEADCLALLKGAGIPLLSDGLQAAQAVAQLAWYQEKASRAGTDDGERKLPAIPPVEGRGEGLGELLRAGGPLTEFQSKRILGSYGIPVTREALAGSAEMAVTRARQLGYPVALKLQSAQILHKTEADGIRLDLGSDDEVRAAYEELLANAERFAPGAELQGVLVQEMLGDGVEVIIGTTRDPVFGQVIMFGLGGIFVEALRDVSFRIAPLSRRDAREMIEEIKGYRVLQGIRGREPADVDAIVDAILRVSRLVEDHRDEIEELDINPLRVFPTGAKAVDALVATRGSQPRSGPA